MNHHPPHPYPPRVSASSQSISSANGHVYDPFAVGMLMGEIRQQGNHTRERLDRIDHLLEHGDRRMSEMTERIASLERRPSAEIPATERWVKDALRYAIPVAVLYGTGSVDAAAMWLKMLAVK